MEQGLVNKPLRESLIAKGHEQVKRYSWKNMAREILTLYKSCA